MMAEVFDDGEFWLPSHFLNDEDLLHMNKENIVVDKNGVQTDLKVAAAPPSCFPTEFPYEFSSFGSSYSVLSSPGESAVGSTTTTETETESDDDDFFAALTLELARSSLHETRKLGAPQKLNAPEKLEKTCVLSRSPQSTLSGIGSWSGKSAGSSNVSPKGPSQATSPRATLPFVAEKDGWDLIYAAAGQVAKLKMSGEGPSRPQYQQQHGRGLLGAPRNPLQAAVLPVKNPSSVLHSSVLSHRNQFQQLKHDLLMNQQAKLSQQQQNQFQQQHQIQNRGGRCVGYENGRCGGRPLGLPQSAWPPLQTQHQNQHPHHHHQHHHHHQQQNRSGMRAVFLGGSDGSVKRECAGTGVFLPRRYTSPTETRKKPGCSTALLPARVVQALNLNLEDMNVHYSPPRFHSGFASDYDALMARRNALLTQQKRSFCPEAALNHEISLPQEWTY